MVGSVLEFFPHFDSFHHLRYENDIMEQIVETLRDYYENEEIKGHIIDEAFKKLVIVIRFIRFTNGDAE
jgi:hypothetical protein